MRRLPFILALASLSLAGAATAQGIRATVDGDFVNFSDVQPIMQGDRVMVPVRGVFEHMNAHVFWDARSNTVIAHHGTDEIRLPINSYTATVKGRQVSLDTPATLLRGRTMVPLRFLSESLGATVEWVEMTRTVELTTASTDFTMANMDIGTVMPFQLNTKLSSNESKAGDVFTANLDTGSFADYQSMPSGAVLEGHVELARAKSGDTPGVLGLAFDRIKLADGRSYPVVGSLIGLDSSSITNENGRLVAKSGSKNDNLKYIGYGAGGGALLAVLTKGNILTNTLIGAALGLILGEVQKNPTHSRDVTLQTGSKFGVRLRNDLAFRVASKH